MSPETLVLHEKVIRLLRGILSAWDEWVQAQKKIATK